MSTFYQVLQCFFWYNFNLLPEKYGMIIFVFNGETNSVFMGSYNSEWHSRLIKIRFIMNICWIVRQVLAIVLTIYALCLMVILPLFARVIPIVRLSPCLWGNSEKTRVNYAYGFIWTCSYKTQQNQAYHWLAVQCRMYTLHTETKEKLSPFRRKHFQIHFIGWENMNFIEYFTEVCS